MALRPYDDLDLSEAALTESKHRSFFFFTTIALAALISILGIAGGFIYGDYYGRKHAQLENPELRKYYAGQCYSFMDNQLKKTLKNAFDKQAKGGEQLARLDEIRGMIQSLQMDLASIGGAGKKTKSKGREIGLKKKVAYGAQ